VTLTVASIVKNEAGRFLPKALKAWCSFADRVVVIDDGSTDGTPDLLESAGVEWKRAELGLWGNETAARTALWDFACPGSEWVVVLDADMVPARDPKPHLAGGVGAFRLYDMWGGDVYRDDAWWTAHHRTQLWAARVDGRTTWSWDGSRGIHADRMPSDVLECGDVCEVAAPLLHYAYSTPALRAAKFEQYGRVWDQLEPAEQFHARTILHPHPILRRLPVSPTWPLL